MRASAVLSRSRTRIERHRVGAARAMRGPPSGLSSDISARNMDDDACGESVFHVRASIRKHQRPPCRSEFDPPSRVPTRCDGPHREPRKCTVGRLRQPATRPAVVLARFGLTRVSYGSTEGFGLRGTVSGLLESALCVDCFGVILPPERFLQCATIPGPNSRRLMEHPSASSSSKQPVNADGPLLGHSAATGRGCIRCAITNRLGSSVALA